jgi:hypothetical protein
LNLLEIGGQYGWFHAPLAIDSSAPLTLQNNVQKCYGLRVRIKFEFGQLIANFLRSGNRGVRRYRIWLSDNSLKK